MSDLNVFKGRFAAKAYGMLAEALKLAIVRIIYWAVKRGGLSAHGLENLPPEGSPYIVVSSHQLPITAEVAICIRTAKRKIVPWANAAQESAGVLRISWLYRHHSWGIIPIKEHAGLTLMEYLERRSRKELGKGRLVWIAPEGKFSFAIGLRKGFSSYVNVLAKMNEFPIVPMTVVGAGSCEWHFDLYRPHPDMRIIFGKPFRMADGFPKNSIAAQSKAADEIMLRIAALMPKELHGYYTDFPKTEFKYTEDVSPEETEQ